MKIIKIYCLLLFLSVTISVELVRTSYSKFWKERFEDTALLTHERIF